MLLIYTIIYFVSLIFYFLKLNVIASGVMIALAIFLYVEEYKLNKNIINVKGLFALGFVGGFGLSLLKLSNLSGKYSLMTCMTVYLAYFSIYLGSYFAKRYNMLIAIKDDQNSSSVFPYENMETMLIIIFIVTLLSFLFEAKILGFIPLFTINTPHAYSTFHVYMLHYITTFYIFIPSVALINYFYKSNKRSRALVAISFLYVVVLAALMLSRGQMIMSFAIAIFVVFIHKRDIAINILKKYNKRIIILIMLFAVLYVFITIERAHDVSYLKGIFEMKNDSIPIFIAQPYMYVAHNFENLNYMINNIAHLGFGRMTLWPLFTLTMAKKIFPFAIGSTVYIIKTELSTKTLIYDFYYDFGVVGVIVFCGLIGLIGTILENYVYQLVNDKTCKRNTYIVVLFALYCYYMLFSFLQSYFSLTDTWVNIIALSLLCVLPKIWPLVVKKHNK